MDVGLLAGSALMLLPAVSSSVLGIAVCCPTARSGTACTNFAAASKSGLVMLRYRDQKLVSTVSCMRLVSRPPSPAKLWLAPVALLLGSSENGCRLGGSAPFDSRYLPKNGA